MKKRRFPFERSIGFFFYGIAAFCVIGGICNGFKIHAAFMGSIYYILGMICDPKSDLYDQKK